MGSLLLVNATDLDLWANRLDCQGLTPQLIRRLVHASVRRVLRMSFRSGEGVHIGGWDGILTVDEGNAFVPDGTSVWEVSTCQDVKSKADEDYDKRTKDPQGVDARESTFVFVTPRRWGGKDAWVAARQTQGVWRKVLAYDADDLEAWLEIAPAVHVWLSILLGRQPEGADDLESFWEDWSKMTQPAVTPEFVLSGRAEVVQRVNAWLREPSVPLALQAESRDEAVAVFAAALLQFPQEEQIRHLARTVVVRDLSAWRHLTIASTEPLILVQTFDSHEAVPRAIRRGHNVVIPLGHADSSSDATVIIPRLSQEEAAKALIASGIDESRAVTLAKLACRSLMSFRRTLAPSPGVAQPKWARPSEARALLPAMFAGTWNSANEGDRSALSALARAPYEALSEVLVRWSNEDDPPVRHVGGAWHIVSKEDAWRLLARYLTCDDLKRFEEVTLDVLGMPDPRFDLPADQQWMAPVLGHVLPHSDLLRRGLAGTLALMGTVGDATPISAGASASNWAGCIVRRLLRNANADWRVWASLSDLLPLLAEASPSEFLSAVEEGISGEDPPLLKLFADKQDDLFGSSPHTGLLFALETLAWSPEYFSHAALFLAKLARLDPGGKLLNRPHNSLREIFLPWCPQTTATLEQRLQVLDAIRDREPEVAWRLMVELLPEFHAVARRTAMPRWRDWAPDSPPPVTGAQYVKAISEIVKRVLEDVGENGSCWRDLIEALPNLPGDQYEAVVGRLESMNPERLDTSGRVAVWNALRDLIAHHRSFPDAEWALPKKCVDRLYDIYQRFEPEEIVARYAWLFVDSPRLPQARETDWQAQERAVAEARLDAVRSVHACAGLAGLLELAEAVERPDILGVALGRSDLLRAEEDELLHELLTEEDSPRARCARGFVCGRIREQRREWGEAKLSRAGEGWPSAQRAQLLACLPFDRRTWDLASRSDSETEQLYWRFVRPYWLDDPNDIELAVRGLLEHGRPYAAVDLLGQHVTKDGSFPPALIADALEHTLRVSPEDDTPLGSFSHHVVELLELLEASGGIDEHRVATLEWAFLPILEHHGRGPKVLHGELARNPDFFAEVLSVAFRAEGEEPRELSEEDQARARHGFDLLDSWRTVPGSREDGTIDADALKDWVRRAREAAQTSGRGAAGDRVIGRILSYSPAGLDGAWPHEAVRGVIEDVASKELEREFENGVYNRRGVVTKSLTEGGTQERKLAERYSGFAAAIRDRWPRTAAMLRRIADRYCVEAEREDQRVELEADLDL